MGTNYYLHHKPCGECGRKDVEHIGKNLSMFEALTEWDSESEEQRIVVGSWERWRQRICSVVVEGGCIIDEYGREHAAVDFIRDVQAVPKEARRRHYDWMAENMPASVADGPAEGMDWLDPDGFSFTAREFT